MFKTALSAYFTYKFLRLLVTKWEDTPAFKLGIIDEKGNRLVKGADMSDEQKKYYTSFDRLVYNLKRIVGKLPGGRFTSWAAAALLIKENLPHDQYLQFLKVIEDAPASVAAQVTTEPGETSKKIKKPFKIAKRKKAIT